MKQQILVLVSLAVLVIAAVGFQGQNFGQSVTPSRFYVTSDFTTSGVGTNFETITGLSWSLPANTAVNVPFDCHLSYIQNTAAATMAFGMQAATVSPTNIQATSLWNNTGTTMQPGQAVITNTTATQIGAAAAPADTTTVRLAYIWGFIENPSNASPNTINIMVKTGTAADTVTIKKDSYCLAFLQ